MTSHYGTSLNEITCDAGVIPSAIIDSDEPVVLRGLVSSWPIVLKALESDESAVANLVSYYNRNPVLAFLAEPEQNGRIFYNDSMDGFNFHQSHVHLDEVLHKLLEIKNTSRTPTYYLGSLVIDDILPGFLEENDLSLQFAKIRKSIWLGNQSVIAPHFDFPDNIACCVIGRRRFTLFPPEQLANLYVGPIDLNPGGQQISMVDVREPDLDTYPQFAEAMDAALSAELEPGDALYIPSMWWHSVESLSEINGLVNYWWRNTPDYLGIPNNALLYALLSIKSLPERQRKAWQNLFNHYIFEQPDDRLEHLPDHAHGRLGEINETIARKLRAQLLNGLK
jgi:hypothetical protein